MKVSELRKKYPEFVYKGYTYEIKKSLPVSEAEDLEMSFDFEVPPDIKFQPRVVIKNVSQKDVDRVGESTLDNFVFHLGLAEMPSYWKATASPKIIVEAGSLNKAQINWWHDLFMKGMGQYFFENKLDFRTRNFLTIEAKTSTSTFLTIVRKVHRTKNRVLVPIGGGKDAVVTYEILKASKQTIKPFILNPRKEQLEFLNIVGERGIVVERTIDPKLLELNQKRYLNGHTPFSAYLAFLTTLYAALFGCKYIALSNERSSNEENVQYLGHGINHQYSKSFEFEEKFRSYSKKYLAENIEYFSFLRPLYELQIAKLFSSYPKYFETFLSCNEAHKTNSGETKPIGRWCGMCSKCLFVFASLYPFVRKEELVKIFGSNLFENKDLIPLMEELIGERSFKPFECVGTTKESLAAFYLSLQKTHAPLPILLKHFRRRIAKNHPALPEASKNILTSWNKNHAIPAHLEKHLRSMLQ